MSSKTITVGPRSMEEMAEFEKELNAIREEALAKVGDEDARYIKKILWTTRLLETTGRGLLMFGWFPPTWLLGVFLLGCAKIIDNMELGHNVMHGQFNFMNDRASRVTPSSGTTPAPAKAGATPTTSSTTPTPMSSARTATSATACCACPMT